MVFSHREGASYVAFSFGIAKFPLPVCVSYSDEVSVYFCRWVVEFFADDVGLVKTAKDTSYPMERNGDEYFSFFVEGAALKRGVGHCGKMWGEFGSSVEFEGEDHFAETFIVDSSTGDGVEVELFIDANAAAVVYNAVPAYVASASEAVIAA